VAGALVGLVAALLSARALSALLFETDPYDPLTLGGVAATLLLVAVLAAWLPARRVVRLTTVDALKGE
jgi:putative ABC transport system permease protein